MNGACSPIKRAHSSRAGTKAESLDGRSLNTRRQKKGRLLSTCRVPFRGSHTDGRAAKGK